MDDLSDPEDGGLRPWLPCGLNPARELRCPLCDQPRWHIAAPLLLCGRTGSALADALGPRQGLPSRPAGLQALGAARDFGTSASRQSGQGTAWINLATRVGLSCSAHQADCCGLVCWSQQQSFPFPNSSNQPTHLLAHPPHPNQKIRPTSSTPYNTTANKTNNNNALVRSSKQSLRLGWI